MKKQVFSRLTIASCLTLLAALLVTWSLVRPASGQQEAQENDPSSAHSRRSQEPTISAHPVLSLPSFAVVPATGTMLIRNRDSVFATIHTAGLPPGAVVTAWLAVFNNPQHCATRPCTPADFANPHVHGSLMSLGGKIIGADGTATYGGFRQVGDTTGIFPGEGTGEGLLNTRRAEIHLAMRTHGLPSNDPDVLRQQLSTFNGGCPPNTCATIQLSPHQP